MYCVWALNRAPSCWWGQEVVALLACRPIRRKWDHRGMPLKGMGSPSPSCLSVFFPSHYKVKGFDPPCTSLCNVPSYHRLKGSKAKQLWIKPLKTWVKWKRSSPEVDFLGCFITVSEDDLWRSSESSWLSGYPVQRIHIRMGTCDHCFFCPCSWLEDNPLWEMLMWCVFLLVSVLLRSQNYVPEWRETLKPERFPWSSGTTEELTQPTQVSPYPVGKNKLHVL